MSEYVAYADADDNLEQVWGDGVTLDLGAMAVEPPEEGWHRFEIVQLTFQVTSEHAKTPNAPMVGMMCAISNNLDPDVGKVVWSNLVFDGGIGSQMAGRLFAAIGWALEGNRQMTRKDLEDELLGQIVDGRVKIKPAQKKYDESVEIRSWRAPVYDSVLEE